jgi:hypothetical protein
MQIVDTNKELSTKVPFYTVKRDEWGWVRECVKAPRRDCQKCLFSKKCKVENSSKKRR